MTTNGLLNLETVLFNQTPLLDVRSPVEYSKGALFWAKNRPLLTNEQRELIGVCYKNKGEQAAIALGESLASPEIKAQRVEAWLSVLKRQPETVLYCFRGGLRSRISQQWLKQAGVDIDYIPGGYKALRRCCLAIIERACERPIVCLSGSTGTQKTLLLKQLDNAVDLEELACHRGSAFGGQLQPQPTQINFENALAVALLQADATRAVWLEDEAYLIGARSIPLPFHQAMQSAPIVLVELSLEKRVEHLIDDYILQLWASLEHSPDPEKHFEHTLLSRLANIQKRLGGARYQQLNQQLIEAIGLFFRHADPQGFVPPIQALLRDYYDPMYQYKLAKRQSQVCFQGSPQSVMEFAAQQRERVIQA